MYCYYRSCKVLEHLLVWAAGGGREADAQKKAHRWLHGGMRGPKFDVESLPDFWRLWGWMATKFQDCTDQWVTGGNMHAATVVR
jgi:hypothetical protein